MSVAQKMKDSRNNDAFFNYQKQIEAFYNEYKHQTELKEMENRLYQRIMKDISVKVINEASPTIREIGKEFEKYFK